MLTSIWNICGSHYSFYLFKSRQFRTQTTMHTQNLLINNCCNRQTVEAVCKCFPEFYVVASFTYYGQFSRVYVNWPFYLTFTFIVKSIYTINTGTLMVSSEQEEVLRVFDFISKHQAYCFKALFSTIHIISQKKIVSIGGKSSIFKESKQVEILSMNVS
jgi:hypothetical protein